MIGRVVPRLFAIVLVACMAACPEVQSVVKTCGGAAQSAIDSLVKQAVDSASNTPGAPSWSTFSSTTLLAGGEALAVCVAQKAIEYVDGFISPTAPTAKGHLLITDVALSAAPAHERLADFLDAHGATHAHPGESGGGGQ